MGESEIGIHITGCPSIDIAAEVVEQPRLGYDPIERFGGVGERIDISNGYIVVMQHPVTTEYTEARAQATETLHAVEQAGYPVCWFWPNVDAGSDGTSKAIRAFREQRSPRNIHFFKNLPPSDFLRLCYGSRAVVGNSSVGIRECTFLGIPVVNIGSRQRGRERGINVSDAPHERNAIKGAVEKQYGTGRYPADHLYGDGNSGKRIADVISRASLDYDKTFTY